MHLYVFGNLKCVDCPYHEKHKIKCPTNKNDDITVYICHCKTHYVVNNHKIKNNGLAKALARLGK